MEFELSEAKLMKTVINALLITDDHIHVRNTDQGLQFQNKRTQIVTDVILSRSCFSKFNMDKELDLFFGIKELASFINLATNQDKLVFSIDEKSKKISILLESETMERRIDVRLLASDADLIGDDDRRDSYRYANLKQRELPTYVEVDASLLSDAVKTLKFLGEDDDVEITHSKDGLMFSGKAGMNSAEVKILHSSDYVHNEKVISGPYEFMRRNIDLPEKHQAVYNFELIRNIPKLYKSGEMVSFKMIDGGPMIFQSNLPEEMGSISFGIAPMNNPNRRDG